jgi:hypothetical protein
MTSRWSASLIGSKHRRIWNIYDITSLAHIPVVFIYAPGLELTIPGVKKTERAEIRRYVMLDADLLFGSHPEDMTTWIAKQLGLVACALTCVGAKSDSMLSCSPVVAVNKLRSNIDQPFIPKGIDQTTPMTSGFFCFLIQIPLHFFIPWFVHTD